MIYKYSIYHGLCISIKFAAALRVSTDIAIHISSEVNLFTGFSITWISQLFKVQEQWRDYFFKVVFDDIITNHDEERARSVDVDVK